MAVDLTKHEVPVASRGTCFLCGQEFGSGQLGQEHVFAKWLQGKFCLWDRTLVLLNGTEIPYRSLKTPACAACNNVSLSKVEAKVARALPDGAAAVRALGHEVLYLWVAKMFFGILYAEALLPLDRKAREAESILEPGALDGFRFMHLTMQAARTSLTFNSDETKYHSSIMVFPVQEHPNPAERFMYRDDVNFGCVAVRLGTVGVICVTDGGAQERLADEVFAALYSHQLHPLQFEEISAKVFAKARTFTRTPKYISTHVNGESTFLQMPMGGLSESPIFADYDHEEYARMLATFTSHPLHLIWPGDGSVQTWIRSYKEPYFIDVAEHPWP